jgi:hypothetical protein
MWVASGRQSNMVNIVIVSGQTERQMQSCFSSRHFERANVERAKEFERPHARYSITEIVKIDAIVPDPVLSSLRDTSRTKSRPHPRWQQIPEPRRPLRTPFRRSL